MTVLIPTMTGHAFLFFMTTLNITLKKYWFDLIKSGVKKHEYREIKPYWNVRLFEVVKPIELIGMNYDNINSMFWYSVGFKGSRAAAMNYLIENGYIKTKNYDTVSANNGYQKDCPNIKWLHKSTSIGTGNIEWGAVHNVEYFVLDIGDLQPNSQST